MDIPSPSRNLLSIKDSYCIERLLFYECVSRDSSSWACADDGDSSRGLSHDSEICLDRIVESRSRLSKDFLQGQTSGVGMIRRRLLDRYIRSLLCRLSYRIRGGCMDACPAHNFKLEVSVHDT